jgi:hypothetical protein
MEHRTKRVRLSGTPAPEQQQQQQHKQQQQQQPLQQQPTLLQQVTTLQQQVATLQQLNATLLNGWQQCDAQHTGTRMTLRAAQDQEGAALRRAAVAEAALQSFSHPANMHKAVQRALQQTERSAIKI